LLDLAAARHQYVKLWDEKEAVEILGEVNQELLVYWWSFEAQEAN